MEEQENKGFWAKHKVLRGLAFFIFLVLLIDLPIQVSKLIRGQRRVSMRDALGELLKTPPEETENFEEVDWKKLRTVDSKSPETFAKFHQKYLKIPGFMVPLEDAIGETAEFLLVPSQQACIHVPPPPMNQTIYVRMRGDKPTETVYGPIWVEGRFFFFTENLRPSQSLASFGMEGIRVTPYRD